MSLRNSPVALPRLGRLPRIGPSTAGALVLLLASRAWAQDRPAPPSDRDLPTQEPASRPPLAKPEAPATESAERLEIRVREWLAYLRGHVGSDTLSPGMTLDIDRDLGLEPATAITTPEVAVDLWGYGRLSAAEFWSSFKGESTFQDTVVDGGRTEVVSVPIDTRMDFDLYALTYTAPVFSRSLGEEGRVEFGLSAGARYMAFHWTVTTPDGVDHEGGDGPTPVFGGRVSLAVTSWTRVDLEVLGFGYSDSSLSMGFLEGSAEVSVFPWKGVALGLGYQYTSLRAHGKDSSGDFRFDANLRGVFVSLGLRF